MLLYPAVAKLLLNDLLPTMLGSVLDVAVGEVAKLTQPAKSGLRDRQWFVPIFIKLF